MADQDQIRQQFKEFTQANDSVAKFYLDATNYNLDQAVENYFKFVKKPTSSKSSSKQTGAFSFRDLQGEDAPDDDDEQRYYAGSGQQVLGDKKKSRLPQDTDDLTDKIFKKAQEQGAQTHDQFEQQMKQPFSGTGQRLGSTNTTVPTPQQQRPQQQPKETKTVTITFYKEGFTIDDGELRRFDEPKNKEFLQAIDEGYVPREVSGMASEVMVNLVNKKTESYVPPPKTFKAFEGGGRTLSSAPSSSTATFTPTPGIPFSYQCDESKPFTTLQIRLHDGTRLVAKFNLCDTVETVLNFVQHAKAVNKPFTLMTAYPKKVLDNPKLTIEEAGLKNAQIMQTLV